MLMILCCFKTIKMHQFFALSATLVFALLNASSCTNRESSKSSTKPVTKDTVLKQTNPVVYFEIPVTDILRAKNFYTAVFGFDFTEEIIHNNQMALFPFAENGTGITGALAKGEIYKPTKMGTLIYFHTADIESTLKQVIQSGGKILYPKTSTSSNGFVAEFEDSEGNRIALSQTN
jgi:uncharacterized protein